MVRATVACMISMCLLVSTQVASARSWIIEQYELQDFSDGVHVTGGGYNGADYDYASGASGVRRAYWKFDFPDVPSRPALYLVEQWVPTYPTGVTGWAWLPIEVNFSGRDGEPWPYNESIPWSGQYGQNHQWLGMNESLLGQWQQAGPGPQAPNGPACEAGGDGLMMWMRKGSWLYTKWDFGWQIGPHAITALRITELNPSGPPACDPPTLGGPIDLRCVGNSDPLYAGSEYYGGGPDASVDGNSLGAEGYVAPNCFTTKDLLSPGLASSGQYAAHLSTGDVEFKLRFDGNNSLKWRGDDLGTYARSNIYTLNDVAGREFVEGRYARLHLLSVKGGGSNGALQVEAVYTDDSVESMQVNLYDWFNEDGDSNSVAVGVDGLPRSTDLGVSGFKRLGSDGAPDGGGDHSGAFLFVHTLTLNKGKTLKQIRLGIADPGTFGGDLCVLAATLEVGCSDPVFDVIGPSGDPSDPDGAVDQLDFAVFQICYTGAGDPYGIFDRSRCGCLDVDGDQDIDPDDYAGFVACSSGPGIPADPACDD